MYEDDGDEEVDEEQEKKEDNEGYAEEDGKRHQSAPNIRLIIMIAMLRKNVSHILDLSFFLSRIKNRKPVYAFELTTSPVLHEHVLLPLTT